MVGFGGWKESEIRRNYKEWFCDGCVIVDYLDEGGVVYVCRYHASQTGTEVIFNGRYLAMAWFENVMCLSSSSCNMGVVL